VTAQLMSHHISNFAQARRWIPVARGIACIRTYGVRRLVRPWVRSVWSKSPRRMQGIMPGRPWGPI